MRRNQLCCSWVFGGLIVLFAAACASAGDFVFAPFGTSTRTDLAVHWMPVGGPTGPNDRVITNAQARGTGERTATAAQIPDGFELVWITDDPGQDAFWPQINNCGEIVFAVFNDGLRQYMLYDNGKLTQLTFGAADVDGRRLPDINNQGTIVWQDGKDALEMGDIVIWNAGALTTIGHGLNPVINDAEQIVWHNRLGVGCWNGDGDMFFWEKGEITQLTQNFLSNQLPRINAHGHAVWTHYDFCLNPWDGSPALFDGESIQILPSQLKGLAADITDDGIVAWGGPEGIEVWENGKVSSLTNWGRIARLNESGDISFIRWHVENETWQVWLYSGSQFYQVTDDPFWNTFTENNDYGEVVLTSGNTGERRLRLVRRVRNGDLDIDGQVDASDYIPYADCATGPFDTDRLCDCRFLDMDHDRDVDLQDFAAIANGFGDF